MVTVFQNTETKVFVLLKYPGFGAFFGDFGDKSLRAKFEGKLSDKKHNMPITKFWMWVGISLTLWELCNDWQ